MHFCQRRLTLLQYAILDASACSQESSVRVSCCLDGVLRAPCLVPRNAAAIWNRLPPRLDVVSDAVLLRGPCLNPGACVHMRGLLSYYYPVCMPIDVYIRARK